MKYLYNNLNYLLKVIIIIIYIININYYLVFIYLIFFYTILYNNIKFITLIIKIYKYNIINYKSFLIFFNI